MAGYDLGFNIPGGQSMSTGTRQSPQTVNTAGNWNAQGQTTLGADLVPSLTYYDATLQARIRYTQADFHHAVGAKTRTIGKGQLKINLRRMSTLEAHTIPLIEGFAPKPDKLGITAIEGTVAQYGRFAEFTDRVSFEVKDPIITEMVAELADVRNETVDLLAAEALYMEAQSFFAGGATSITALATNGASANATTRASAKPKLRDFLELTLHFKKHRIKPFSGGKYKVLASPAVMADLLVDEDMQKLMDWGQDNSPWKSMKVFNVFDMMFVETLTAKQDNWTLDTDGNRVDLQSHVHHTLVLGQDHLFKITNSAAKETEFITKGLGSSGTHDPLNQRQTMGWKMSGIGFKVERPEAVVDYMSVPSLATYVTNSYSEATNSAATAEMLAELKEVIVYLGNGATLPGFADANKTAHNPTTTSREGYHSVWLEVSDKFVGAPAFGTENKNIRI